jgi:hypothetical protein
MHRGSLFRTTTRAWQREARSLTREEVLDAGELGLFNTHINLSSSGNVRLQPKHVEIFSRIAYLVCFVVLLIDMSTMMFNAVSRSPRDASMCTESITVSTTAFTKACTN